ncbi:MAG: glycoside hydrolase family 88 protein [Pseudosphingobacterium sp.]|uniref:glycoside hydrolase family 88 protein n=1 Tax=Olivibacter jilunii TaxID=985016 RepID=UPI0029B37C00|nr:glycoside hydrolase family 88 protein [Olivibacter sp. UJ_SKK_5.1]MDX3915496.1 glycoside hydrolase family 88 protein [Pseudosphingobacterium sp.]
MINLKNSVLIISLLGFLGFSFRDNSELDFVEENLVYASAQLDVLLKAANEVDTLYPRTLENDGTLRLTNRFEWTSGFFPGMLWYVYEGNRQDQIKQEAIRWTEKLNDLQYFTEHHDLGFMLYCSYGNGFRLTGNNQYRELLVQGAKSLATRFSAKTGSIKSWNGFGSWDGKHRYKFPVIIDNMMNLELLFFASKVTGDPSYRQLAIKHAETVMKNQLRPDFSCFHIVCYDPENGAVLSKETGQGYADNSTWARGQAWGIYGFTMAYRETGDPRFLTTANRMADFYINHPNLPSDKVPYWDFNANQVGYMPGPKSKAKATPTNYRDVSAAAVATSAFLELSRLNTGAVAEKYLAAATTILHALASPVYRAPVGANGGFLLRHSVGSIAHGVEIDVPLVYADYYFLEALNRYKQILVKK